MNPLNAIRDLAVRWTIEGCRKFDDASSPAEVAEAAGQLRCAVELFQLLNATIPERRGLAAVGVRANAAERPGRTADLLMVVTSKIARAT